MWQASIDTHPGLVRLVLTQTKSDSSDPCFVAGREWSTSPGQEALDVQLHCWEQELDIEIDLVVHTPEGLFPMGRPTALVPPKQVAFLARFWQELTLPAWQRGIILAVLASLDRQKDVSCKTAPERLVMAFLARRIMELETFIYGDEVVSNPGVFL